MKNPFDAIELITEKLTLTKENLTEARTVSVSEVERFINSAEEEIEAVEEALEEALKASDAAGVACDHLRGILNDVRNILVIAIPGTKLEKNTRQILQKAKDALEVLDPAPEKDHRRKRNQNE